jgi:transcriptional regulator with XRE-family HTH domain
MPKNTKITFKDRVRAALAQRQLQQADLARKLGISQQALYSLLKASNPRLDTIERVAAALGCPASDLVSDG